MRPAFSAPLRPGVRFGLVFMPVCGTLYFLAVLAPDGLFEFLAGIDARMAGSLLGLAGLHVVVRGEFMTLGRTSVELARECTILFVEIPFLSLVLAAPAALWQKLAAAVLGTAFIMILNAARIGIILAAGMHAQWLVDYVHSMMGQVVMVMAVVCISLVWLSFTSPSGETRGMLRFVTTATLSAVLIAALWTFPGSEYSRAVIAAAGRAMGFAGYPMAIPAGAAIMPNGVDPAGMIFFLSLVSASVLSGVFPGPAGLAAGLAAMIVLQVGGECIMILDRGFGVPVHPVILKTYALVLHGIAPLGLWRAVTARAARRAYRTARLTPVRRRKERPWTSS